MNWVNITPSSDDGGTWVRVDQIVGVGPSHSASGLPTNVYIANGKFFASDYGTDELMARLKEFGELA